MKSLIRWSASVALVGSAVAGAVLANVAMVLALPKEQIIQKLGPIPIFTIANGQGSALVIPPAKGQKGPAIARAFINISDARAFLSDLKTKNPEVGKDGQVVLLSLAEVFQANAAITKEKPEGMGFVYLPSRQQVDSAVSLLKQSGEKVEQFNVTPLFVAFDKAKKSYLPTMQGDKPIIPVFFNKEDLQATIDRSKQQQPEVVANVEIQVLSLEGLIEAFRTKDEPLLQAIELVPSQESRKIMQDLAQQQKQQPGAPAKPAAKPKK